MPEAVAFTTDKDDIMLLIEFALELKTLLIPRTAGTSLAEQVVGKGIVVDVSKYMNSVINIDTENKK